jgi:gamma-aminobutyric acid receptor subunit alpha
MNHRTTSNCSANGGGGGVGEHDETPPERDPWIYKLLKCLQGSASYKKVMMRRANPQGVNTVSKIDKAARVLFPLSFIILNTIYWTTYTK